MKISHSMKYIKVLIMFCQNYISDYLFTFPIALPTYNCTTYLANEVFYDAHQSS